MCSIATHQLTESKSDPGASPVAVRASAAMRGCLTQPNHASGEDMAWSHGSIASIPIEWQRETRGAPHFRVRALAMHSACPRSRASTAMRGCLPRPNHALGEDMAWSCGSVASRPI